MRVKALKECFAAGSRRRRGSEFEWTGKKLPKYLVSLEVKGGRKAKEEAEAAPEAAPTSPTGDQNVL